MSATTNSPTYSSAGGKIWAILGAAKVTVKSAFTQGPMIRKVSDESPEGISIAILKALALLISSMTVE